MVSDEAQDAASGHTITVLELKEMIDAGKDFALIDVREQNEFEIVRIPGSVLIPKDRILSGEALAELPQDKPIVLHCKSGARSADALAALHKAGFRDAVHVGGGVLGLGQAGRPLAADLLISSATSQGRAAAPARLRRFRNQVEPLYRIARVLCMTGQADRRSVGDPLRPFGGGDGGRTDGRRWTAMRPARVRPDDSHDPRPTRAPLLHGRAPGGRPAGAPGGASGRAARRCGAVVGDAALAARTGRSRPVRLPK